MKLFLDSIDLEIINDLYQVGLLSGVTTNPTLAKRFNMKDDIEMVHKIREAMPNGEIHVEAFGNNAIEIEKNAIRIAENTKDSNVVFKIPFSKSGLKSVTNLRKLGYRTNLHLVFSLNQAFLSSSVGSDYICPLLGRLDDAGHDAISNLIEMINAYKKYNLETKIMASSIRNPLHVIQAFKAGVDVVTVPSLIIEQMFNHPLTSNGYELFKKDLEEI
tara:strand:+ start:578 stop:1228 length:651 start_codon:yes stop_codon:yes gene_type:complete